METTRTKQDVIGILTLSPHGDLAQYRAPVFQAIEDDPDFFSHLIAHNQRKGAVRDAKVGLPLLALASLPPQFTGEEYEENAFAHLALQSPKQLLQAYRFALKEQRLPGRMMKFGKLIGRYLKAREMFPAWWNAVALQHRESLKALYALTHTAPSMHAQAHLFDRAYLGGVFNAVRTLRTLPTTQEIGGIIEHFNIPYLVARGALGARMKEPDVLIAVIDRMSPTEIVTNARALQKLGAQNHPAVRAALGQGLVRARKSKANVFKTTQAAQALAKDDADNPLVAQLEDLQERQLVRSVAGNWLVLADKSSSMLAAIEAAQTIAGTLARMVQDKVALIFFDAMPYYVDVTGKTLAEIKARTKGVQASGQTSIGSGLMLAIEKKLPVDGIVIVSDGGENHQPFFAHVYGAAYRGAKVQPPVYFYKLQGDPDRLSESLKAGGVDLQTFELTRGAVDYYALPNLVQTMSVKRYDLVQAILDTPLLTISQALRVPRQFREEVPSHV